MTYFTPPSDFVSNLGMSSERVVVSEAEKDVWPIDGKEDFDYSIQRTVGVALMCSIWNHCCSFTKKLYLYKSDPVNHFVSAISE